MKKGDRIRQKNSRHTKRPRDPWKSRGLIWNQTIWASQEACAETIWEKPLEVKYRSPSILIPHLGTAKRTNSGNHRSGRLSQGLIHLSLLAPKARVIDASYRLIVAGFLVFKTLAGGFPQSVYPVSNSGFGYW